ncbi:discoidin domain-containing protein [Maribacter sp. IgM3_T14_3]|uniref:galactose-binding domain-containing protein n=1 Tax=Maribacter sp. IgM3_T14_3 TaxID=3415140 RepID=UPI003C6FC3E7
MKTFLFSIILLQSFCCLGQTSIPNWQINNQTSWNTYTDKTNNLDIVNGLAKPINDADNYSFRSKLYSFEQPIKANDVTFKQSTVWDNWIPVSNIGPREAQDAPILISVQKGEYYLLARLSTTSGYQAWQSSDMINWNLKGPVTGTGDRTGKWATTAEYKDGKFYIYYDATNDDKPTLVIDEDLTDGIIGVEMGVAFDDPTPGSDCSVFRDDADGLFHIIYEDWSPINARTHAWDSPLAGHVSSEDGLTGFVYGEHPAVIDQRTTPTGDTGTYDHPQMGTLTYNIHEPAQNAYGDFTTIKVGSQYYIFGDYDPIGENMKTARFTSDSWDKEFELVGSTGSGHPDPTIAFAEGQFYLVTQQNIDYVSPGPWVDGVTARAGVDEDGDGLADTWTDWQTIKETYDHKAGYARVVDVAPATINMSNLPEGYGFQFEFSIDNTLVDGISPLIDSVEMTFKESDNSIENIAYLKPTSQSSNYSNGGQALLAVDGTTDGKWVNGSVSHTKAKGSANPWWRVDLGAEYPIGAINIFNRTDENCWNTVGSGCNNRLEGAKLFVGTFNSSNPSDYKEIATLNSTIEQNLNGGNTVARYIMIYLEGSDKILSLAEVQVFEGKTTENSIATLYQHITYAGIAYNLNVGEYPNISMQGISLNSISSALVTDGYTLELYSEINFEGEVLILDSDNSNFIQSNFNDKVSSVKLYQTLEVTPVDNLAFQKPVLQSSTSHNGSADRAVDGNTSSIWSEASISHTGANGGNGTTNPWWRVDLGNTYTVSAINIFNRIDSICANAVSCPERLLGAKVFVGNTDSSNPNDYNLAATLTAGIEQKLTNLSITGRYVMIYHEGTNKILSLAEVQVYGMAITAVSLSADNIAGPLISMYPNPVDEFLYLSSDITIQENVYVQIYTSTGILAKELEVSFNGRLESIINVADLNTGVYVLRIFNRSTGQISTITMLKN